MNAMRAAAAAIALAAIPAVPTVAEPAPGASAQSSQMSDAMVQKVGTALAHVSTIRQQYAQRAQSVESPQQREVLNNQAQTDMLQAISGQGLSVQQYDQAIQMAQADPSLKQRIITAAQSAR